VIEELEELLLVNAIVRLGSFFKLQAEQTQASFKVLAKGTLDSISSLVIP